jgi:hypothetical protein
MSPVGSSRLSVLESTNRARVLLCHAVLPERPVLACSPDRLGWTMSTTALFAAMAMPVKRAVNWRTWPRSISLPANMSALEAKPMIDGTLALRLGVDVRSCVRCYSHSVVDAIVGPRRPTGARPSAWRSTRSRRWSASRPISLGALPCPSAMSCRQR